MADVRFILDAHQVKLSLEVINAFLNERPKGETQNLIHSIAEILSVRLGRRAAERRLEHKFILPVYQALALRRLVMTGVELCDRGRVQDELRRVLAVIDPLMTRYIHLN